MARELFVEQTHTLKAYASQDVSLEFPVAQKKFFSTTAGTYPVFLEKFMVAHL